MTWDNVPRSWERGVVDGLGIGILNLLSVVHAVRTHFSRPHFTCTVICPLSFSTCALRKGFLNDILQSITSEMSAGGGSRAKNVAKVKMDFERSS